MNEKFKSFEKIQFKNWVKKRFISSIDTERMLPETVLLWAEALRELSNELINTTNKSGFFRHEIVPFHRGKG